jgi:CheY-like chemotaxis protein/anti-sigma regulatory factor (Ser/Thr protein kinase)
MPDAVHILVVEDNELDRKLLKAHLDRDEFDTRFAVDGVEAWDMLDRDPARYDLVLLDRTMPRMSGLELLARMKADPRFRTIPVILQTAHVGREEMIEGMRAGAYYYLTKPYDAEVLLTVIRTAAADHEEMRQLQLRLRRGLQVLKLLDEAHFSVCTVDEARDLAAVLANACPDPESAVIGLTELLVNAVEHGNLGITYEEKSRLSDSQQWAAEVRRRLTLAENAGKRVDLRFERTRGEIRFTIRDAGNGFEWKRYLEIDPQRAFDTHGRGILLARHVSLFRLEYRGCGNEVTAVIPLAGAAA